MRTGGTTMPSSAAIWRRSMPMRASRVPPALLVHQRDQPEADLQLERVERRAHRARRRAARARPGRAPRRPRPSRLRSRSSPVAQRPADGEEEPPRTKNGSFGRPGTSAEDADQHAGDERRLGLVEELLATVEPRSLLGARRAGDDDAGGDRDQQRRDLRDEAVADRQQREVLAGLGDRHALLDDADEDAADDVDAR